MSAYRQPGARPVYELEAEPDPFAPIMCNDCGETTYSACGEDLCARCDLKWLRRGVDWHVVMQSGFLADRARRVTCAFCVLGFPWPDAFPSPHYAECHSCARARVVQAERKKVAFFIAKVGEIVYRILDARGIR